MKNETIPTIVNTAEIIHEYFRIPTKSILVLPIMCIYSLLLNNQMLKVAALRRVWNTVLPTTSDV